MGMTIEEVADLTRLYFNKDQVHVLQDLDLNTFRKIIQSSNDPTKRILINFHRGPLFGTGGGHHSPIGGYLADEDLVFRSRC